MAGQGLVRTDPVALLERPVDIRWRKLEPRARWRIPGIVVFVFRRVECGDCCDVHRGSPSHCGKLLLFLRALSDARVLDIGARIKAVARVMPGEAIEVDVEELTVALHHLAGDQDGIHILRAHTHEQCSRRRGYQHVCADCEQQESH